MFERIAALKLVPVIVIERAEDAELLGDALLAGGLPVAEVTLRTDAGYEAIQRLRKIPEMLVGAGTVLTAAQAAEARGAGAQFIVSPGLSEEVVGYCRRESIPVLPGVATPTEIQRALALGVKVLKFFPAETLGGVGALKAVSAPFREVMFVPTGGITAENMGPYLALKNVLAVGGSWMVKSDLMRAGQFDAIRELVSDAVQLMRVLQV